MKGTRELEKPAATPAFGYRQPTAGVEGRRPFGRWLEQVCNQLSDLRRCQRQRELAQSHAATAQSH